MVFKAALLGNLILWSHAAGSQSQVASEKGKGPEAAYYADPKSSDDQANRDDDLERRIQPNGDDNEQDDDIIDEEDADADDVDVDESPPSPRFRRFGRRLSISRTLTTVSAFLSGKPAEKPAWLNSLKEFMRPTKSELRYSIPNYRYTPIFSGIVIPFSILLEIPGLTEPWYVRTEGNQTVEAQTNPVSLDVALACSIACAVIANVCLVTRFLEKRVYLMTVLCVIFLTIHDIINVIVVTIFGASHQLHDGFTYGQAFWMTLCSTVASFLTNITLIVDLIRTPNFSKSGSGLTRKQRSLVVVVIILLCYIAFGSLVNSFLIHLKFVDALYFTVVTIETVGFGDITPKSTGARVFVCTYACFGILNLGLAVAMTRETVLEALQVTYRKRLKAVRERRTAVRRRRRIERRWREAVEWRLREARAPIWVKNDFKLGVLGNIRWFLDRVSNVIFWRWHLHGSSRDARYGYGHHPHGKHLNIEALGRADLEAAALEAGVPLHTLIPAWLRFKSRDSSRESMNNPDTTRVGDVVGGINGIWREKQRDERDHACQTMPLTHVHMSRMAGMIRKFALAMHASSQTDPTSYTRGGSPVFPGDSAEEAGNHDPDSPNVEKVSPATDAQNVEESPATNQAGPSSQEEQVNIDPLPPRILSPVDNVSKVDVSLAPQKDESGKIGLASEERKAFYAKVTVAWLLFIVFWTVGSAIFSRTEGWSYGIAIYFCFIAFTTIGYGDYYPKTPAGRSVFVVWALLGIGTMTILISVLSEAYSSRYKNAITTHTFEKAVKRYRHRIRHRPRPYDAFSERTGYHFHSSIASPSSPLSPLTTSTSNIDTQTQMSTLNIDPQGCAQQKLEALPLKVLRLTKTFHEHVRYLLGPGKKDKDILKKMPIGLKQLLCEITDAEIGAEIREEILQDDDARRTFFTVSIEQSLRDIAEVAEDTLNAVKMRDEFAAQPRTNTLNADGDISQYHEKQDA